VLFIRLAVAFIEVVNYPRLLSRKSDFFRSFVFVFSKLKGRVTRAAVSQNNFRISKLLHITLQIIYLFKLIVARVPPKNANNGYIE
jgi:hypothetical protein